MKLLCWTLTILIMTATLVASLFHEYKILISWSHVENKMSRLASLSKTIWKDRLGENPESFMGLSNNPETHFMLDEMYFSNEASNEVSVILYWLPLAPEEDVVFITASPIRKWLSNTFFRLYVNKVGEVKIMNDDDFIKLVEKSVFFNQKKILNSESISK